MRIRRFAESYGTLRRNGPCWHDERKLECRKEKAGEVKRKKREKIGGYAAKTNWARKHISLFQGFQGKKVISQ